MALAVFGGLVLAASGFEDRQHVTPTADTAEPKSDQAPKIVAVGATFNYGKVKQGAAVEHSFKIKNEGGGDLIIRRAKGS